MPASVARPRPAGHARRRCATILLLVVALSLGSCVAHSHRVGLGPTGVGETGERQYYILFGLIATNEINVQRMAGELTSYSIDTEYSFVDLLLAPFLLPLTMTSRTVTVRT